MRAGYLISARAALSGVVLGLTATFAPAQADTLADALVGAYEHSGLLEQNRALLRAADEDVAFAAAALKPIINWSADITRDFGDSQPLSTSLTRGLEGTSATAGVILQMLLWDNGASRLNVDVAKESILATRQNLISIEQQVLFRAVSAYFGVLQAAEFVRLRQNNTRLLTQELKAAQDRFEVGEVTRTDVAQAEAALAQARSGLAQAEGSFLQAEEEYRNAVGRRPGTISALPQLPKLDDDIDGAKALALRIHPDLRAAQHQVAAAELAILRAKAQKSPTLNGVAQYGVTEYVGEDAYTRGGNIGLQVTGPIYQGGALDSNVRQAIAQRDAQRSNLHVVQHDIRQNVGNAYAELSAAKASLAASLRGIEASEIAFEGVREEATLGARTTLDVLNAEQDLLDARATYIQVQTQLYVATYLVLSATGRLTAKDLRLNVPQYDPAEYYNLAKDAPTALSKQGQQLDKVLRRLQKN